MGHSPDICELDKMEVNETLKRCFACVAATDEVMLRALLVCQQCFYSTKYQTGRIVTNARETEFIKPNITSIKKTRNE